MQENIYPTYSVVDKKSLLKQNGLVIWLTGLSGSGKSTIAQELEKKLYSDGILTKILDGDNLRVGLNKDLKFSNEDRIENIRRVAEVAKLFVECDIVTICSFVSPTENIRNSAKAIIGPTNFHEIFINASFEICSKRDVKGIYKKALNGEIKNFTGIDSSFEIPVNPFLNINTNSQTVTESVNAVYNKIISKINNNAKI